MARKKNEITLKEPVRIRKKELKDGNKSLYLDIYMNGNRKKEGLKLYIVPEVNAAAKQQNKNTWKLAIRQKSSVANASSILPHGSSRILRRMPRSMLTNEQPH